MILENVDVAKRSFTLKFSDTDIAQLTFGADKYGYTEMRVEVVKKDEEGNFIEGFSISYHWDSKKEEAPAFVMDMMAMLHKLGSLGSAAGENVDTVVESTPEEPTTRGEEEVAEEPVEEVAEEVEEKEKDEE